MKDLKDFIAAYNDIINHPSIADVADALNMHERTVRKKARKIRTADPDILIDRIKLMHDMHDTDYEIVKENVDMGKRLQRITDKNRIQTKSFREHVRIENAVSEYAKEITEILKKHKFKDKVKTTSKKTKIVGDVGVIHWSDQHLNERVSLPHNTYDWNIASKRLRKHVLEAISFFKYKGIKKIVVAFSGDLINSDRRLDELLSNAGNRAKASVLAVDVYQQALRELAAHFDVHVVSVCGNESRMTKEVGWSQDIVTDSYDFTIHEILSLLLHDVKNINFRPIDNPNEAIVSINNTNILVIHGHSQVKQNKQLSVQSIIGRYSSRGVKINMVIWGHVHEAAIADSYARSSSLVGSNNYSEDALGLSGRASQNLYVVHKTGGFDGLKVDLQYTDGVVGYDIDKRLEQYNTKSADKCHSDQIIMKVVI